MMSSRRRTLWTIALAFLAGTAGVLLGAWIMMPRAPHGTELHALLHREIVLDPRQEAQLDSLETQFAVERATLEAHMRSDNAALAAAIAREHDDGPAVAAAVDRAHRTMGALQKATLAHVFAMRRLLRPDQTAAFDRLVVRALTPAS